MPTHVAPPPEALAAIMGVATHVLRQVQIVDSAGVVFADIDSVGIIDGSVTVDQTRAERRAFELTLDNSSNQFVHAQGQLWYDKIIKIWHGVQYNLNGVLTSWTTQVGEFMIDEITSQHFPHTIHIQGRDWTKKLINAQFKVPTNFVGGQRLEDLIKTIALNGGITKFVLATTGVVTAKDWYFDSGVSRWDAMNQLATNYGFELFFDGSGYLVLRLFQDPVLSPTMMIFKTGLIGNLVNYTKASRDSRLFNSVVVIGESSNTLPVYGIAQNNVPGSPTSIAEIGEHVYIYKSSFITTTQQALQVAQDFLSIMSLEEYDLSLEHIVLAWLEGGDIVEFLDPSPAPGEPTRFLLSSFNIPMKLGSMTSACKRVTKVNA